MLKPDVSIPVAAAVVVGVYSIFQLNLPTTADVRVADSMDKDISSATRVATWESFALVSGLSLMARDTAIMLAGGLATIGLNIKYRHANLVNPLTKRATTSATGAQIAAAQMPDAEPATNGTSAPSGPSLSAFGPMI